MRIVDWLKRNYKPLALAFLIVIVIDSVLLLAFNQPVKSPTRSITQNTSSPARLKPAKVELELFGKGLKKPTAIVSTADEKDKRLFVAEQAGRITVLGADGKLSEKPFLDIANKVQSGGEMGLLGLAFHPNFRANGYFYVNYIDHGQHTIIARYQSSSTATTKVSTEKILLDIAQPYTNHNGGDLAFGPDGKLYVALGDGGSRGDPENRAQNLGTLLGKILRLDVDRGDPYSIPADNPFADQVGAREEIWAYGLRNPWRFSFDRQTKDLFIADVGQGDLEEINIETAGSNGGFNYGWRCYEATRGYNPVGCKSPEQFIFPIIKYSHSEGRCSVTGGYVYRGQKYPALNGRYFYGDYCGGQLYFAQKTDGKWKSKLAASTSYRISAFGQDSQGEIYLADYAAGAIYLILDSAN